MANWLTGRTWRLPASGNLSLDTTGIVTAAGGGHPGFQLAGSGSLQFNFCGMQLNCSAAGGCGGPTGPSGVQLNVEAQMPTRPSVTATLTDWFNIGFNPFTGGGARGGTYTFYIDVEEWATSYIPSASTTIDGTNFPNYGGSAQGDGLPASGIQYTLQPRIGGTCYCSIALSSITATISFVIDAALQAAIGTISDYQLYIFPNTSFSKFNANGSEPSHLYTTSWTSPVVQTSSWTVPGATWSSNFPNGTLACAVDFDSTMTCKANADAAGLWSISHMVNTVYSAGSAAMQAPTMFALNARAKCFGNDIPSPGVTMTVQDKFSHTSNVTLNPTAGPTWDQKKYLGSCDLNGYLPPGVALDETSPVAAWLSSLSPDDANDWRCMFNGFKWDAMTITKSTSLNIDPCTSLAHWSAGANTTLSLVGGRVHAAASGGTGSLTLAVPSAVRVWEVYRYLQITGLASLGVTLSASFASQSWDLPLIVTSTSPQLDLCCATSDGTTVNSTQCRYPLSGSGGFPIVTDPVDQYDLGWGVNFCDSLTISGIPNGESITLTDISLVNSSDPSRQVALTILEPFKDFNLGWTSGSDNTYLQDLLILENDYRPCDLPALAHIIPFSGSPTYRYYAIYELQSMLAYFPGITATLLTAPTDGYHSTSLPALIFGGQGATVDTVTGIWKDWIDQPLGATVPAQDLWDEVVVYPGAGNVWTQSAAFGGYTPLCVSKSLRAQGWGDVFTLTGTPNVGAQVQLYETATPTTHEGSGYSNSIGGYLTGTPWAFGNVDTTSELNQPPIPHLSNHAVLQNRQRWRASFRHVAIVVQGSICGFARNVGWGLVAFGDASNVYMNRYIKSFDATFTVGTFTVDDIDGCWRYGFRAAMDLYYVHAGGSGVYYISSVGKEDTWSTETLIASGTQVAADYAKPLDMSMAVIFDSGTWKAYTKVGRSAFALAGTVLSSVSASKAALIFEDGVVRQWRFVVPSGSSVYSYISQDGGQTWVPG